MGEKWSDELIGEVNLLDFFYLIVFFFNTILIVLLSGIVVSF